MKTIKYLTLASMFVSAAMTFTGCTPESDNRSYIDDSGLNSDGLLVYAYTQLRDLSSSSDFRQMQVKGTDLYINQQGSSSGEEFFAYTLTPENSTVKDFYAKCFNLINNANGAVAKASSASDKSACEARFLRAYAYYLLTQHFGGVPYFTGYNTSARYSFQREDVATVYKGIADDLEDVYTNGSLPETDHSGHASKTAVASLLAKIYLAWGWDCDVTLSDASTGAFTINSTEKFANAKTWASNALSSAGISTLSLTYEDKWSPDNEGNEEEIFSVQYDRASYKTTLTTSGHSLQNGFGGYYNTPTATGQKYMNHQDCISLKSILMYEKNDKRFDGTFMTTMYGGFNSKVNPETWSTSAESATGATRGYYAYYNATDEEKKAMGVAYRFYPAYTTDKQVKDDFNANKELYTANDSTLFVKLGKNVKIWKVKKGATSFPSDVDRELEYSTSVSSSGYLTNVNEGISVKKWDDKLSYRNDKNTAHDFRDIVLLHASDIFLVKAEASLMANNNEPNADFWDAINAVRKRAFGDSYTELTALNKYKPSYASNFGVTIRPIDLLLDERGRELYAECQRWMDLRRTKQLYYYNKKFNPDATGIGSGSSIKWYRPIPSTEINSNTAMTTADQNPGY